VVRWFPYYFLSFKNKITWGPPCHISKVVKSCIKMWQ